MSGPPVFHDGSNIYAADACEPLHQAWQNGEVILKAFVRGQYPGTPLQDHVLPGLRTVGFWNVVKEQNWGLDWHRNEGVEVCFLLNGSLDFWTSASFWKVNTGTLTVSAPWQLHRIGNPTIGASTLLWFIIDLNIRGNNQKYKWPDWVILSREELKKIYSCLLYGDMPVLKLPGKFIQPWEKLYRLLRDANEECPVSPISITINEILYDLLQLFSDTSDHSDLMSDEGRNSALIMVKRFFDELEAVPSQLEYPWTLHEMAKFCHISPSRFSQVCYQLTNLSPVHVLNRLRIQNAEKMILENPEQSITQISLACGFASSQYFATVFRKWTGLSPSAYRKNSMKTE